MRQVNPSVLPTGYVFGQYRVSLITRTVCRGDDEVDLTPKEFEILRLLVTAAPESVSRATLVREVWPDQDRTSVPDNTVNRQISNLRTKLGKDPQGRDLLPAITPGGYLLATEVTAISDTKPEPITLTPAVPSAPRFPKPLTVSLAALSALALLVFLLEHRPNPVAPEHRLPGRLLVLGTSEGHRIQQTPLPFPPEFMEVSRDGARLYVTASYVPELLVIDTQTRTMTSQRLPIPGGPISLAPNGELFIGSMVDGVVRTDSTGKLLPGVLQTGTPVLGSAVDPAGRILYLALGNEGLKKMDLTTGKLSLLSEAVCPVSLSLTSAGDRLFTAYQCNGPGGTKGHDSVTELNTRTGEETILGRGLPMVGFLPWLSPDNSLIVLDGLDACSSNSYDQAGCPKVPSHVVHLMRTADRSLIRTLAFAPGHGAGGFLDNSRFVVGSDGLSIVDAARFSVTERMSLDGYVMRPRPVVSAGSRLWIPVHQVSGGTIAGSMLSLPLQPPGCAAEPVKSFASFPFDGALDNVSGGSSFQSVGKTKFTGGRVGESLALGSGAYVQASQLPYFQPGAHDFALALYVKFEDTPGEMAVMDWVSAKPAFGFKLVRRASGHLAFLWEPDGSELLSISAIHANRWYHVAVSSTDRATVLYVDGIRQGQIRGRLPEPLGEQRPLYLGAYSSGRARMKGRIDELNLFKRGLSEDEVRSIYAYRETGPCRI